ncbi:MAG: ComF family protein [Sulfurovum sp.]|nr:ComF family protein [Sulfurovum sp.]MCB4752062.1 ComF family protein [Sulfurovum sp.]MCB4758628.1 ComF family protein [Sulfurovum sp.]
MQAICKTCWKTLFRPDIKTQTVGTLDVISFYRYSTLEPLLLTKHKPEGFRIYKTLGEKLFHPFMQEFVEYDDRDIYIVGIDEDVKSGYSHVAQLTHAMKMKGVTPLYGVLRARNKVNYSGKSLEYRLKNPRDFFYRGKSDIDVILVDDIMTTGITLQEAQKVLHIHGINILFAITLADVDN